VRFVRRRAQSRSILVRGTALVRRSRTILAVLAATFLVNGASDAFGRLIPKRLVDVGPGEIVCGLGLAAVGRYAGLTPTLVACAVLFALTIVVVRLAVLRP
jgi:hypothetical protein